MFIAHLPAGYLLTTQLQRTLGNRSRGVLWAGLIASVFPDLDLLYFYLVDHRQTLHHQYVTHLPMAWVALGLSLALVLKITRQTRYLVLLGVVIANGLLHMVLDSLAAGIYWLYPLSDAEVNFVEVPAHYHWWVWNFILHWTFGLELLVVAVAFLVWRRREHPLG